MKPTFLHSLQKALAVVLILSIPTIFIVRTEGSYYQSIQKYHNKISTLPYPFSTIAEYDETTSTFYGRIRIDKTNYFASINSITGKIEILNKLPSFDGWITGLSALDTADHRFFFIAALQGKYHLCIIDTRTGKVTKSLPLSESVKIIEFNPTSHSLLGISHSGNDKFVSIDLNTGEISELGELIQIKNTSTGAFIEKNNFYFIGLWEDKAHICVVDTKTGAMRELSSENVGVNEYKVKSFKTNKDSGILLTYGVQSCTAIAGYDPETDIGFIAHFAPSYKNIDKVLFEIEKTIQKISRDRSMNNMKLFVVGGVEYDEDSKNNLMTVYRKLVNQYGINYDEITKFSTSISYTIIIYNDEIKIF